MLKIITIIFDTKFHPFQQFIESLLTLVYLNTLHYDGYLLS